MWQTKNDSLYRKFEFDNFDDAFEFMGKVALVAKQLDHHPRMVNTYNVVELEVATHDAGNTITDKDHEFARQVDELFEVVPEQPVLEIVEAKLFADGGSRGNPGPSALGYALLDMQDSIIKKEGIYLGITTNNQAEYRALKAGLEEAIRFGIKNLHVYMDSMLVIKQVRGEWKMKNADLAPINAAIREMIPNFDHITFSHVPRELNKIADGAVNECLDSQ